MRARCPFATRRRERPPRRVWRLVAAACAGVALATGAAHSAAPAPADVLSRTNEAGVVLALSGQTVRAESLFVSVLSQAPRDARALTNLGNVALLRGEPKLALSYYARAARSAPQDPGIDLDRAVACLVQGDAEAARAHAARAVRASGGADSAAALLGLVRADTTATARGADATRLAPEEIEALLKQAATNVPAPAATDSVRTAAVDSLAHQRPAWRSAGPRSLDTTAAATLLYWKQN